MFNKKEKHKHHSDKLDLNCQYRYAKIKHRRYYCLDQNPAVLAWVLLIRKETLSPGFKLESKSIFRWIYWWYRYNYNFFKTNFKILIAFMQHKLRLTNIESDLELPFYGQLCMIVHKGYKIFDLRRGVVTKVFNPEVDAFTILSEVQQLKNISEKIKFAPSIRRWNFNERWYEEDYIQGSLEAGQPPDSENLLDRFYTCITPCIEKVMLFQPPININTIELTNEITKSLYATELFNNEHYLLEMKEILDFTDSIVERLRNKNNSSVYLMFTHGDFCPENMLKTKHGLQIFDWESAKYRSALFDFFSYFFYRPVQHNISVDKLVLEINTAFPFLISSLSLKVHDISNSLLPLVSVYRWIYYLERILMLVERKMTDTNIDIMKVICRYINAFSCYEKILADSPELTLRNINCTSNA
jgi:hypothetical protein